MLCGRNRSRWSTTRRSRRSSSDFIIDECHRSTYNLWRQVVEYFDASLVGLTATPDKRALGFFNKKVVSMCPHERAVADGVNVGYEVWGIQTEVTTRGGRIPPKRYVEKRERGTRRKRSRLRMPPGRYVISSRNSRHWC